MGRNIPDQSLLEPAGAPVDSDQPLAPAHAAMAAGSWMAKAALFLALAWVAAVGCVTAALAGFGALGQLAVIQWVALAFAAFMPAGLLLFAGAAAREGVRAQAMASRLADAADRMMNPSPVAEAAARRLGISVRGEIAALDRSLEEAMAKLAAVETVVTRQKLAVEQAAATAQQGAGAMISGLERERAVLMQISSDLDANVARLGETVRRQSQTITGAAHEAETQLRAVDQVLEARLNGFGAAANVIGERTGQLAQAAASTADSTHRLETALAGALDTLAQATSLTETAKKSTEAATLAANATAGAVRDTTNRAIDDARRVAELIRAEAQTVEREAAAALERLREAAEAARVAAVDAREITGALPPKRPPGGRTFSFIPGGKDGAGRDAARDERARRDLERLEAQRFEEQVARVAALPDEGRRRGFGEQFGFGPRIQSRADGRVTLEDKVSGERGNTGRWNWREMLGAAEPEPGPAPHREPSGRPQVMAAPNEYEAPRRVVPPPVARSPEPLAPAAPFAPAFAPGAASPAMTPVGPRPAAAQTFSLHHSAPAVTVAPARMADPLFDRPPPAPGRTAQMMESIGVRLPEVFSVAALDRIAARARNGTQARRRAVRDAAPEAVLRLSERFDSDPRAREEAARFLEAEGARIADLLGRGRASMSADATRAFLLIDAASS
ncbi:MAG: hypothetical protein NW200_10755 [Hyphomonadaceae bacterium]|nr:hypothetical protein [Hyphomonadaceae bacterium]